MTVTDRAAAVALASLPGMSPARLRALRDAYGLVEAWHRVLERRVDGHPRLARCLGPEPEKVVASMARAAALVDPAAVLDTHRQAQISVLLPDDPGYPEPLVADPEAPVVLFARGHLEVLDAHRVAVVGTRRCTRVGRGVAVELGEGLATAGITVVSGLALGIDGAAHEGALRASPSDPAPVVGVVGSGLDVVYPTRHRSLWDTVGCRGLLVSEWPLGTASQAWRFPARNRIIAALAEVVVVVESHARGGALNTAEAAIRRSRDVLAVPGSVRSPASRGTNALLFDGAAPVRDTADVLGALGFAAPDPTPEPAGPSGGLVPDPHEVELLDQLAGEPRTLDQLVLDTGRDLTELSVALLRFEHLGWVARSGSWYERIGP